MALRQYYPQNKNILSPPKLRRTLKKNVNAYDYMSSQDKLAIFDYCLSDHMYKDLSGLKLLPLLNGSFVQFTQVSHYTTVLYICSSSIPHALLPGLEHMLVSVYSDNQNTHLNLTKVAKGGQTQFKILGVPEVARILPQSNPTSWSDEQFDCFWQWLHDKELHFFHQKQIVPIQQYSTGQTSAMPLTKRDGVVYISPSSSISSTLSSALEKCGIKLANSSDFPYLVHRHLTQYLYQFNPDDILLRHNTVKIKLSQRVSHLILEQTYFPILLL